MRRGGFLTSLGASVSLASISTCLPAPVGAALCTPGRHARGSFARIADYAAKPAVVDPTLLAGTHFARHASRTLPSRVVLPGLPPVVDQGSLQSCEAHAIGYGLGGYTASRARDGTAAFDIADPANQPSRAWLFEREHRSDRGACTVGTAAMGYLEQLVAFGAPSEADVPYRADCRYISRLNVRADDDPGPNTERLRVGSFRALVVRRSQKKRQLAHLRRFIANGHAIAISGKLGSDYDTPALRGGVYYAERGFCNADLHAQLVVGYDDTLGDPRAPGAFLIQNSWGTAWNASGDQPGRIWMAYDAFFASQTCAALAYPATHALGSDRGTVLHAKTPDAPACTISQAHLATGSAVVLAHAFTEPVRLDSLTLREGTKPAVRTNYGTVFQDGYTVFNGSGFRKGRYHLTVEARLRKTHARVVYRGDIVVTA